MYHSELSLKIEKLLKEKIVMFPMFFYCGGLKYNDLAYDLMTNDTIRVKAYRDAIEKIVKGKKVVEIGTGRDAVLSVMSAKAGAEKVYAIERNKEAFAKAKKLIEQEGLDKKIDLILGSSFSIELPEKVDICLSELIGNIGGQEGAIKILKDASRFLKQNSRMIPDKCITKIVPVFLPKIYSDELIEDMISSDIKDAFGENPKAEDLSFNMFNIFNFPKSNIISEPLIFEDINFNGDMEAEYQTASEFTVNKDSDMDGFLLWLNLSLDSKITVDSLEQWTHWGQVFIPLAKKLSLKKGDIIY